MKLKNKDIIYINQILLNDEVSTNEELINLFIQELGISKDLSEHILSFRDNALTDLTFNIGDFLYLKMKYEDLEYD